MLVTRACGSCRLSALAHQPCNAATSQRHALRQLGMLPQQRRRRAAVVRAAPEDDLDQQLQQDLDRLRQRQAATGGPPGAAPNATRQQPSYGAAASSSSESKGAMAGVKDAVDKILIADFFFILFSLGWLGVGLAERSALQSTHLLDTWLSLWQWVFQPALGVLMLGALVSGGFGWAKENFGGEQR